MASKKNGALTPNQVTPKSHRKVWWQCEEGHEWETSVQSRTNVKGCPNCYKKNLLKNRRKVAIEKSGSLLEKYPDYVFGASQAQHYLFTKEYYPELYEKIKKYVKEGRWEIQGATWVEHDCNVISGESMIRQFVHGKNFYINFHRILFILLY